MKIRVTVPATAGRLGSALDSLGVALGLANEVILDTSGPEGTQVEGEGAELLAQTGPNLVRQAFESLARATGRTIPPAALRILSRIPPGRGLGSTAAILVGGLLAADALADTRLSRLDFLRLAISMEGHPDQVAPALYGGAVLAVLGDDPAQGPLTVVPLGVPGDWKAVLYLPDHVVPASRARTLLPESVPRADAIYNQGRTGLLVAAFLQGRPDLLRVAMQDRWQGAGREKHFSNMAELIAAGKEAGAWGASFCGAGPALLALASASKAAGLAEALERKARALGVAGRARVLDFSPAGARIEPLE